MQDKRKTQPTKRTKALRTLIIALVIAIAVALGGNAYVQDYYHAGDEAIRTLWYPSEDVSVTENENDHIVFAPARTEATTGIIFYPGAKVEYTAYAPLMEELAENGFFCVLVHMPGNLAILDMDAAEKIKEKYPEIQNWYLAGHSLGGAMAATYISGHVDEYEGLILLAAYSTKDLSMSGLKVLCAYGSEDEVLNQENYVKDAVNLPRDFKELVIDGGCHSYFGDYGVQKGDGTPTITRDEQIATTVDAISYMIWGK